MKLLTKELQESYENPKICYIFVLWIWLWLSFYRKRAEEFEKQFTCLGESTEKYITFDVAIEKEIESHLVDSKPTTYGLKHQKWSSTTGISDK